MKRVAIITGVSSFLGRSTAKKLLASGFVVFGIVRPGSRRNAGLDKIKNLKLIELDFGDISITDFNNIVIPEIKDADITVIHFAWGATLDRNNFSAQMYNVDYSKKVLEFAKVLGAKRFIFAGSQAEFSDTAYGLAKKEFADEALELIKDTEIDFIHMRIFSIYGKNDRDNSLIKTLVSSIKENKDMPLSSCNYMWNFLYISDFTKIILKLILNEAKTDTYDIASDDTRLLKEYVREAHKTLGGKNKLRFKALPDSYEKFAIPDITKTMGVIKRFKFTKFSDGILKI